MTRGSLFAAFLALFVMAFSGGIVLAQDEGDEAPAGDAPTVAVEDVAAAEHERHVEKLQNEGFKLGNGLRSIGAGIVMIGAGIGIGLLAASALAGIARQPEMAGALQINMIIAAALIEGPTFFALVIVLLS